MSWHRWATVLSAVDTGLDVLLEVVQSVESYFHDLLYAVSLRFIVYLCIHDHGFQLGVVGIFGSIDALKDSRSWLLSQPPRFGGGKERPRGDVAVIAVEWRLPFSNSMLGIVVTFVKLPSSYWPLKVLARIFEEGKVRHKRLIPTHLMIVRISMREVANRVSIKSTMMICILRPIHSSNTSALTPANPPQGNCSPP